MELEEYKETSVTFYPSFELFDYPTDTKYYQVLLPLQRRQVETNKTHRRKDDNADVSKV